MQQKLLKLMLGKKKKLLKLIKEMKKNLMNLPLLAQKDKKKIKELINLNNNYKILNNQKKFY